MSFFVVKSHKPGINGAAIFRIIGIFLVVPSHKRSHRAVKRGEIHDQKFKDLFPMKKSLFRKKGNMKKICKIINEVKKIILVLIIIELEATQN